MALKGLGVSRELSLAEIFQLGYYWETKILLTAVKLDVFSALDSKPKAATEIAGRIGADESTLTLLLNALVALKLLSKDGKTYANSSAAATHLVRHSPIISAICSCSTTPNGTIGANSKKPSEPAVDRLIGMSSKPTLSSAVMCWRSCIESVNRVDPSLRSGSS